jgi:uncharacterized membrane protein
MSQYFQPQDIEQNKTIAALSYFLFALPMIFSPNSAFARFHANQSLVLWLASFLGQFVLKALPVIGDVAASLYSIMMLILLVLGILHAVKGEAKRLFFIGSIDILK